MRHGLVEIIQCSAAGPLQSGPRLVSGPGPARSFRCAAWRRSSWPPVLPAAAPYCRPEEDPFLLLESSLRAVQEILLRRRGLPLQRSWIVQPYGKEELTLLEEEVLFQLWSQLPPAPVDPELEKIVPF